MILITIKIASISCQIELLIVEVNKKTAVYFKLQTCLN